MSCIFVFFFQAEDGIRDIGVTGVQTCALPICSGATPDRPHRRRSNAVISDPTHRRRISAAKPAAMVRTTVRIRSEEHTSELQSRQYLVCRLLLEKKKRKQS